MAFDLVQYFSDQVKIQKPQLLQQYDADSRNAYIQELNALTLGKLIRLWREDDNKLYQEIKTLDPLYIQEVSRHLTTSVHNQSELPKPELEHSISEILSLQLTELKQLDETGNFGSNGLKELLQGQIEHLSGQADDWVWSTNELTELKGSKPLPQEELSLDDTMKEFNQMLHQQADHAPVESTVAAEPTVPGWAKVLEPVVAIGILWILYCAASQMFA